MYKFHNLFALEVVESSLWTSLESVQKTDVGVRDQVTTNTPGPKHCKELACISPASTSTEITRSSFSNCSLLWRLGFAEINHKTYFPFKQQLSVQVCHILFWNHTFWAWNGNWSLMVKTGTLFSWRSLPSGPSTGFLLLRCGEPGRAICLINYQTKNMRPPTSHNIRRAMFRDNHHTHLDSAAEGISINVWKVGVYSRVILVVLWRLSLYNPPSLTWPVVSNGNASQCPHPHPESTVGSRWDQSRHSQNI